ncbi:MAG: hypothetical protein M3548_09530 [Actinomycetota bacterium]|nr:hypothetical protein [Actinomycetota bacterium]
MVGGPVPAGFDPTAVRVEAAALLAKRRRVVEMLGDVGELGERFPALFAEYARGDPRLAGTRARTDAENFRHWLVERGELAAPRRRWWRRG